LLTICPGWLRPPILLISASQVVTDLRGEPVAQNHFLEVGMASKYFATVIHLKNKAIDIKLLK
jgi:hypothetical protein